MNEAKAELLPALASSLYYHCSFGRSGVRRATDCARSARRGACGTVPVSRRGRALAFQSVFAACRAVTWRDTSTVGAFCSRWGRDHAARPIQIRRTPPRCCPFPAAAAASPRGARLRQVRGVHPAEIAVLLCCLIFVAVRSNGFVAQTRKRGETPRARLNRRKWQRQQMIRSPTH